MIVAYHSRHSLHRRYIIAMNTTLLHPGEDRLSYIFRLFQERGASEYHGEAVSQQEHALQAALLAEQAGASPALISAALLHDFGHLLYEGDEDAAEHGINDQHELFGAAWLEMIFVPAVTEPIAMHVQAKRYLCVAEAGYFEKLSAASVTSLQLQGGPMSPAEREQFEQHPHYRDAVALRHWDETAKIVGLPTPGLDHFRRYTEQVRR